MPAHDRDHAAVVAALVADGWTITANQRDQTEDGVAPDLVLAGVPRDRIVLGSKSPARRAVTEYAVG